MAKTSSRTDIFLKTLLRYEITHVDVSDLDFGESSAVEKIRSGLKEDRIYKFVKSLESVRKDVPIVSNSFLWSGVENAVESDFCSVYSCRKIVFIDWKFGIIGVNINPFFFENMNSKTNEFCFV